MELGDAMLIMALWGIWIMLAYWIVLSVGAAAYYLSAQREIQTLSNWDGPWPFVSILVPAHNEAVVIEKTIRALAEMDYAKGRFEVIVINDGSVDGTGEIARKMSQTYPHVCCFDVPVGEGGKGKSRTLNVGLKQAKGELISVFDADNTPEPSCLSLLVATLQNDPDLVAVNSKVRTRNRDSTILTRFINLEFIYFQWLFQGGRWALFGLSMLMGTGYVIRRDALEILGGFDEESLVDDTEMSLRIFRGNRRIRWVPYAVTWEQEPDTFNIWLKQRIRWTQGNLSVTWKYIPHAVYQPYPLGLEIMTFVFNYVLFVPTLFISHLTFIFSYFGLIDVTLLGPFIYLWILAILIFTIHMSLAAFVEEQDWTNIIYAFFCYFTYAQLFILVIALAVFQNILRKLRKNQFEWIKTVRTSEDK